MVVKQPDRPDGRIAAGAGRPAHHRADGGFRNPWPDPDQVRAGSFLRWRWQRLIEGTAPAPPRTGDLPVLRPALERPRADARTLTLTWIGHATFLIQLGPLNVLTDPVWSERVSPVSWAGPRRLVPPPIALEDLPPIDAVVLSHDHYDHLDAPTVRRLADRYGDTLRWITPLGYTPWLARHGAARVHELDWHGSDTLTHDGTSLDVTALPARHWTRRSPFRRSPRLWASFALDAGRAGRVYFGGDSAYFTGYRDIGERYGPFDATLLPVGAYEPRWFMRRAHMNPEEAVRAWAELGGRGAFIGMHWGTFMLSDEPVLEPPARIRAAWQRHGLDPEQLVLLRHGETCTARAGDGPLRAAADFSP